MIANCSTFGKEVGAKICHAFVCSVAWLIDTFCSEPGICEGRKLKWRPVDSVKNCEGLPGLLVADIYAENGQVGLEELRNPKQVS